MTQRHAHPWVFLVLGSPFGVVSGYLTVTIAWQLSQAGIGVGPIAALIATSFIPHTTKFLWAPLVDATLDNKRWYLITGVLSAIGVAVLGLVPPDQKNLALLTTVVLVVNFAAAVVGMTAQALMLTSVAPEQYGRAGGWFQAGNLGGGGLGGGLGLILAERLKAHPAVPGLVLAALCAACILPLWSVHEPHEERPLSRVMPALAGVVRDIWHLACSKPGALALLLSLLPIGSGAASGLWSAVASDWHASANTVALATGVLSGVIMMVGSIAGGWICDRMDRKNAYMLFGVSQALCAIGMAMLPHTEHWYFWMTSAYSLVTGLTYAGYSAFVLESMGLGAAATKFSLYASLSNTPIMYMTSVDGWAHGRFGPSGMLFGEAIAGACGLVFFLLAREAVRRELFGTGKLRATV